jgi:hypothetical protein
MLVRVLTCDAAAAAAATHSTATTQRLHVLRPTEDVVRAYNRHCHKHCMLHVPVGGDLAAAAAAAASDQFTG